VIDKASIGNSSLGEHRPPTHTTCPPTLSSSPLSHLLSLPSSFPLYPILLYSFCSFSCAPQICTVTASFSPLKLPIPLLIYLLLPYFFSFSCALDQLCLVFPCICHHPRSHVLLHSSFRSHLSCLYLLITPPLPSISSFLITLHSSGIIHAVYELYGAELAGRLLSAFGRLFTYFLQGEELSNHFHSSLVLPFFAVFHSYFPPLYDLITSSPSLHSFVYFSHFSSSPSFLPSLYSSLGRLSPAYHTIHSHSSFLILHFLHHYLPPQERDTLAVLQT
jgi:hypothetical protein